MPRDVECLLKATRQGQHWTGGGVRSLLSTTVLLSVQCVSVILGGTRGTPTTHFLKSGVLYLPLLSATRDHLLSSNCAEMCVRPGLNPGLRWGELAALSQTT